jgi:hypothetical protein
MKTLRSPRYVAKRHDGQADLAHFLSALGSVAIAFAQQLFRALDVLAHKAHRHHRPLPLKLVRNGAEDEGNSGPPVDGGGLSGHVVYQDPAHLFDVNVRDGRVQSVPRPSPRVSRHVTERLVLPETKAHLVAVDHALLDRVIAPDPSRIRLCAWAEGVNARRAGKPEAELGCAPVRLPGTERAKLKPRIGHHGFGKPRLLNGRVALR